MTDSRVRAHLPRTLIYEVFVDRFAGPGGRPLEPLPPGVEPWKHHAGGTLDGIAERLEHIRALGADALYLTPIFRAPSNHKYDTESHDEVDPRFGGEEAFAALVERLRAGGTGLILDGVFNHVGESHPWYREARADAAAPRNDFFKRIEAQPELGGRPEYARWRGHGNLPELDLTSEAVLEELFTKRRSVLRRWLRAGATGWRLDCANDLGLDVCKLACRAAAREGARDGVIGEVMTYGQAWVERRRLDGVMNYYFRESILGVCRGEVSALQAAHNLAHMAAHFPAEALLRSWNVLGTHDTPRLATEVSEWRARRFALTLAFTYPGVPLVYYGDEVGLEGGADPDNRRPMPWNPASWDSEMLAHVRRLVAIRRESRTLRGGAHVPFPQPGEPRIIAFARTGDAQDAVVLVVANGSGAPTEARVFAPYSFLFDSLPLVDLLGVHPAVKVRAGRIDVRLEPWQVALFGPDDTTIPGYRFFREG